MPSKDEVKAAEQPLDGNADAELVIDQGVANPVAKATHRESKDPYAEGKHISNPEPNNGQGEQPEDLDPTEAADTEEPEDDLTPEEVGGSDEPDEDSDSPKAPATEEPVPSADSSAASEDSSQPSADER